jgi:alpha-L-fucosidase 2
VDLQLAPVSKEILALPTNKRIDRYKKTHDDLGLETQLFQFGRYLLISASRPGTLPANLQGIWNQSNTPPWHADFHSNINLQMNYWLAEVSNLPELAGPLFDMLTAGTPVYHQQTVKQYGKNTKGFVTRMSINPFGGGGWHWNIEGTAWLAQHFWEHYAFSGNKEFLKTTAWPWLRDVSLFWLDNLKELPDGTLVCPHVWSHEHGPYEDGTAHSEQLMWDLFNNTLTAAKILDLDPALQKRLETAISKLYEPKIGSWGQLMEWMEEKPKLEKSHHRHTSHLFAVYPGHQISRVQTPKLSAAGALSLETRGSVGDSRRSWTWPWRTALWARFGNAEKCHEMISGLIQYNLMSNMITTHRPLQLDGNFGITAGVSEMLLQSQVRDPKTGESVIELLPALPKAWAKEGHVTGLRARGGYVVDLEWKNGKLITTTIGGHFKLKYGTKIVSVKLKAGESKEIREP